MQHIQAHQPLFVVINDISLETYDHSPAILEFHPNKFDVYQILLPRLFISHHGLQALIQRFPRL